MTPKWNHVQCWFSHLKSCRGCDIIDTVQGKQKDCLWKPRSWSEVMRRDRNDGAGHRLLSAFCITRHKSTAKYSHSSVALALRGAFPFPRGEGMRLTGNSFTPCMTVRLQLQSRAPLSFAASPN